MIWEMVLEEWRRARAARRWAKVVLPVHGWPVRMRDGMVDLFMV